ncbi:unnamed protein product [Adineta steineri]|uniref:G-protein coupled receptors family 1 profile domain-containing protein n=1 Tax=Adineta steineri TaxID=433720 RepID=A0A818IDN6_9BILA|nr:unnamed protein product [Adineta steineri]
MNRFDKICKIRYFASLYTDALAFTLFILASLDRLLEAQRLPALRRWGGRVKLAYKLVFACTILCFLISCHRLILYSTSTGHCLAQAGIYATFDNYFESVVSGICPPIIILIQTISTNVEHNKPTPNLTFLRKTDKQLTIMLIWQTFVAIPAFIPYAALLIYSSISTNWSKSDEWLASENIVAETIRLLSYTFFSTQFYVLIISSHGIRKQVLNIFIKRYTIHPTT